ncbi:MAG: hypothetical protein ACD_9C00042G0002 [uncultured bacterium]|nr:MAG: hypothetical protein ACD_9C00042G0002 [uncultured bacterium]
MPNTAEDYSDKLDAARKNQELPNPGEFNVPQKGRADNYDNPQQADNYNHQENRDRLTEAREKDNSIDGDKNNLGKSRNTATGIRSYAEDLNPRRTASLLQQMNFFKDLPFFAAFGAAILKDFLDLIGIGSLPAIGTVITICASLFIGAMLFLEGVGGRKKAVAKRWIRRFGVLGLGTIIEFAFGINFLPVETLMVFLLYTMTLKDRARSDN